MGVAMCRGLAEKGYELIVFDVSSSAVAAIERSHGAIGGASAADVASRCDALMISVPGPDEDEEVMLGADGVLAGAASGLLVLDATTIGVPQARRFAERAAAVGVGYLDTPVSIIRPVGGTPTLTFMVGGDPADFARARPILDDLAPTVRLVGPGGAGSAAKLLNQAIYIGYMTLFAEALSLGEEQGIAIDPLLDVLATSSAGIPNIAAKYDEIRGHSNNCFAIDSALKYLDLTAEAFRDIEYSPVLNAATTTLRNSSLSGLGKEDLIVGRRRPKAKGRADANS
jgi:3-hydroxyisobutyrate dehydrogenase-like beta-hydroxyacid dehydrogenase